MSTILLDEHLDGFLTYLESLVFADYWREIAVWPGLRFVRLVDVGIATGTTDRDIWRFCQTNRLYLLTDNRAEITPDALGAVILAEGTAHSLPVFTIGNMDRFRTERSYGQDLAKSLLQYLFDLEGILGAGRIYLP